MSALHRIVFLLALVMAAASQARAQETVEAPENQDRIVEGRPALYSFKRAIHPLTWIEAGTKPILRLGESGWLNRMISHPPDKTDKSSGVKFGLDGVGAGSGFGPLVTFFKKDLFGKGIDLEVPLLYTYGRYEVYRANITFPLASETLAGRLNFDAGTGYQSRANDAFFGIGNFVRRDVEEDRYRTVTREASLGFSAKFNDRWKSGVHETYRNVGVTDPLGGRSAQDRYSASEIPALFSGATLLSTVFSLDHNNKDQEQMAAEGGRQHVEVSLNEGIRKGDFSYWKYRLDFQQFFKLTSDRRTVIALRGLAETNQPNGGSSVPFFDMPILGTAETLRGYDTYRFRDKSAVALSLEYRYRIWRAMDWAFFLDEGQVAPQIGAFGWNRFHPGYGVRLFVLPKPTFPISFDVGHSSEKWRAYVNFNANF